MKVNNNNYIGEYLGVIVVLIYLFNGIWCMLIVYWNVVIKVLIYDLEGVGMNMYVVLDLNV